MDMGFEASGEITEVGPGVDASKVGTKVAFWDNCASPTYTGTWR